MPVFVVIHGKTVRTHTLSLAERPLPKDGCTTCVVLERTRELRAVFLRQLPISPLADTFLDDASLAYVR